jgi:O-antigen/teichoic acid export membrane protein
MNKKQQTLLNIVAYVLTPFIVGISNIFKMKIFINEIGSLQNGLYQFYFAVLIYFTIVEQSMDMALYAPLYKYIVQQQYEKINALLAGARTYWHRFGLLYLGISLLLLPLAPVFIGSEPSVSFVLLMHVLYTLRGVFPYWFFGPRTLALADNRGYLVVTFNSCMMIVSSIVAMIVVYTTHNLLYAVALELVITCLFIVLEYLYLKRQFPLLDFNYTKKKIFDFSAALPSTLTTKITDIVINNSDIFLVTLLFGASTNSGFAIFVSFSAILITVFGVSVMSSMQSLLGKYFEEINHDKAMKQQSIRLLKWFNYILTMIVVPLIALALNPFIRWFYGPAQAADFMFYLTLIVFIYVRLFRTPYTTLKISLGHYDTFVPNAVADAVLKVVLSLVFAYIFGVYGVLLGTIVAYLLTEFWLEAKEFDMKILQKKWSRYIVETIVTFILTIAISMGLYLWLAPMLTDFLSLLLICFVVGVCLSVLVIGTSLLLSADLRAFAFKMLQKNEQHGNDGAH